MMGVVSLTVSSLLCLSPLTNCSAGIYSFLVLSSSFEHSLRLPFLIFVFMAKMTTHGDLYYEGKEFEIKARERTPGTLSRELKDALGMSEGSPPPWLVNMQRYGPPPSYPQLKIPGLNAPIPPGASFGYGPGCWGRPPVDEYNRPLYGDVFGLQQQEQMNYNDEPIIRDWGAVEDYIEEESDEDESVDEEIDNQNEDVQDDIKKEDTHSTTGTETPDVIELRKRQKEPERPLFQVLEVKEEMINPGTLLGTTHTYVMKPPAPEDKPSVKRVDHHRCSTTDKVEVTLRTEIIEAEEKGDNVLENLDNVLAATNEVAKEEERLRNKEEDFSDMVAENEKKRKRKMQDKDRKSNKKRDFKF
ncbi:hypothetical protein ACHQM5_004639 [Ranunculus cassubicifolius]